MSVNEDVHHQFGYTKEAQGQWQQFRFWAQLAHHQLETCEIHPISTLDLSERLARWQMHPTVFLVELGHESMSHL